MSRLDETSTERIARIKRGAMTTADVDWLLGEVERLTTEAERQTEAVIAFLNVWDKVPFPALAGYEAVERLRAAVASTRETQT